MEGRVYLREAGPSRGRVRRVKFGFDVVEGPRVLMESLRAIAYKSRTKGGVLVPPKDRGEGVREEVHF